MDKMEKSPKKHFDQKDKPQKEKPIKKSKVEVLVEEIKELETKINNEVPPTGKYSLQIEPLPPTAKVEKWEEPIQKFRELPLSHKILKGLSDSKYFKLTPIQRATLPHSLAGRDIMGASKTGSGKTLCFLIPLLELLYRQRWSREEGLGALVIVHARELAIQIFEVINKIGKYHNFSVGMVIGGNNLERERNAVGQMNILIGTPGRLLQHITETPYFSADNLKILAIDEADRILDEGFEESITEILKYLPKSRQTLLFSATLTRNIKRLAKMNLRSPEYINLSNTESIIDQNVLEELNKNELSIVKSQNKIIDEEQSKSVNSLLIPVNLNQFYTIVEAHEKINVLYSFLKTHKTSKCLVFVSSCKEVRFFAEIFKKLKLGMTILDIHGRQKQGKRTTTFYTFSQKRNSVVLFATDVASRGVDFPAIDWVIQLDAPEDIAQYIHRVGRTARYKSDGNSVLFVTSAEEPFVSEMKQKKIDIKKMSIQPNKITDLKPVVRSLLAENAELVPAAQKAISSYVKSINLFANKKIFDVKSIDLNKLALSYGLVGGAQIVVKKKDEVEEKIKNDEKEEVKTEVEKIQSGEKKSKLAKLKEKIKQKKLEKQAKEEEEDDFLVEKKKDEKLLAKKKEREDEEEEEEKPKKKTKKNKEGSDDDQEEKNEFYNKIKERLSKNKDTDKTKEKERIATKHREEKKVAKMKDYEKHGINVKEESSEEGSEESVEEKKAPKNDDKKLKINLEHSSIKEKEKVALELLKKKNKLFG